MLKGLLVLAQHGDVDVRVVAGPCSACKVQSPSAGNPPRNIQGGEQVTRPQRLFKGRFDQFLSPVFATETLPPAGLICCRSIGPCAIVESRYATTSEGRR